jgi:hypothetical protein
VQCEKNVNLATFSSEEKTMKEAIENLNVNELPEYDLNDRPTGCCPRFDPAAWDDREIHFKDKLFVQVKSKSLMHVPLNIGSVFKKTFADLERTDAADREHFIVLSRDVSPWTAEHFFAATKDVPARTMTRLSGDYRTKVFEGPFSNMRKWCGELQELGCREGNQPAESFFFYTTCPTCAKKIGKNYVVGLVATTPHA